MANNWTLVENNFPSFSPEDSAQVRTDKLLDYLRQLSDQLKFILNNLGQENWNSSSLEALSKDLTGDYSAQVQEYSRQVNRLQSTVSSYTAQLAEMTRQLRETIAQQTVLLEGVEALRVQQQQYNDIASRTAASISSIGLRVDALQNSCSKLFAYVTPQPDGVNIGGSSANVELTGNITINGVSL